MQNQEEGQDEGRKADEGVEKVGRRRAGEPEQVRRAGLGRTREKRRIVGMKRDEGPFDEKGQRPFEKRKSQPRHRG